MGFSKNKRVEEHVGGTFLIPSFPPSSLARQKLVTQLTNYILGITGHFIPTGPQWRKFFAEFFRDPFGPIVSPSPPVKEEEELYIPPPADAYAIRNFPVGKTLPMRDLESEEEEKHERRQRDPGFLVEQVGQRDTYELGIFLSTGVSYWSGW